MCLAKETNWDPKLETLEGRTVELQHLTRQDLVKAGVNPTVSTQRAKGSKQPQLIVASDRIPRHNSRTTGRVLSPATSIAGT